VSYIAACGPTVVYNIDGNGKKIISSEFVLYINSYYDNTLSQQDWMHVLTHELGHALGIGVMWKLTQQFGGAAPIDSPTGPYLDGAVYTEAQSAYNNLTSSIRTAIPLEASGGVGTASGHWDDTGRKALSSPYLWSFGNRELGGQAYQWIKYRQLMYFPFLNNTSDIEEINLSTHGSILKNNGHLYTFGLNDYGQLGNGEISETSPFYQYHHVGCDYEKVSLGYKNSFAIKANGDLYAWGINYGTLGDGSGQSYNVTPTLIGYDYEEVSAGGSHSLALKTNGDLYAWGRNNEGQLGDNTNINKNVPTFIGSGYSKISAGGGHSLALKTNGDLYAWGWNLDGQLGDGTNSDKKIPTFIGSEFSEISAGDIHSLALKTNGDLYAWGFNDYGQLGDNALVSKNTPTFIGSGYSKINAGTSISVGLKANGDLYSWGYNYDDNLGFGDTIDRIVPTKLVGQSYTKISTGNGISYIAMSEENIPLIAEKYKGINELLSPYFSPGSEPSISSLSIKTLVDFGYVELVSGANEGPPTLSNVWPNYFFGTSLSGYYPIDSDVDSDSDCIAIQSIQNQSLKIGCENISLNNPVIRNLRK